MTPLPPLRRVSGGLAMVALSLLVAAGAATAVPDGDASANGDRPARAISTTAQPASTVLTPQSFADPPRAARPMYRYWVPLAYTDDDVLRAELQDIARAGAGGIEIAPFIVPGAGNQTNAFLAEYGWGTPRWAHKLEVITAEAARLGLSVDQSLGPHYPATVPTLNSFNQPEAEQQLIYGREFNEAGTTRTGALPAPLTAPPSLTRKLCGDATAGDEELQVDAIGGFAVGDSVTVGVGDTAEKVVVTGLGRRTDSCADLFVSALAKSHAVGESAVTVARTTRIRTLVAQCVGTCSAATPGPVELLPSSVRDVTAEVHRGTLAQDFPTGNGNPWVLLDILQTASGLVAQRGGYTATQPNYVVDHWSRGGVQVQSSFWDEHILTEAVQTNLDAIGRGALFEDSLELGESQKWTWGLLGEWTSRRGYDPTLVLPALLGAGIQGTHAPAFELAELGPRAREDYRRTMGELHISRYVAPMQRWARSHGLDFRVQSYGIPVSTGDAATAAGIAEGESLNFGSPNPYGAEQDYRVVSGGAHAARRNLVSVECCAVFQGGYRSSIAGPNVAGQFGEGGDGSQVGGRYSQGLLDSVYKAYAGGVNQLVWHGYAYRDAPGGVGSSGRDGSWPGYHPWDIFGVISVNDEFGPRQASWPDYAPVNDALARTQLVLRQGRAVLDLGVYYEDLGLAGSSVSGQQSPNHMLGTSSATSRAGYTYEYVTPGILGGKGLAADEDGGILGDRSDLKAVVLNDQRTISLDGASHLLALARDGLRVFVVGQPPSASTGVGDDARLATVVAELLDQPTVQRVATEADLPAALKAQSIRPAVAADAEIPDLGLVRRVAGSRTYDFVYNRSGATIERSLTLSGRGRPYLLDTWTGRITPVAAYTTSARGVTVKVRVPAHDKVILALDQSTALGRAPGVHATSTSVDVRAASPERLVVRTTANGRLTTPLSNGARFATTVSGLAPAQTLATWTLNAQTWTPGDQQWTTLKTDHAGIEVRGDAEGRLPSWREIVTPADLSKASGIGTYTTTLTLPETWNVRSEGAYLDLGDVLDTAQVRVNGSGVTVNQSDRGRIDLGKRLRPGVNTVTVRVATTMFNAVRQSGDSNYQMPPWQRTGLIGPVVLTPYRDTAVPKASTRTTIKLSPSSVRKGGAATLAVRVVSSAVVSGQIRVFVGGRLQRTTTLRKGVATIALPRTLRAGTHRVRVRYDGTPWLTASSAQATLVVRR